MTIGEERREDGGARIRFEALVEVGGALGPSFEAQAVDISQDGMHLRTAYLPEVGQPLTCRFDAGSATVLASGEVIWREEQGRGGEFGIQFTNLDPESAAALARIVGMHGDGPRDPGARVRLHIEGLGSPMRAKVKDSGSTELRVGSDLGFLQVGKQLELEDAATGRKRPARIDKVDIEVDATSHVPQLIVTLRYDDETSAPALDAPCAVAAQQDLPKEVTPGPSVIDDDPVMEVAPVAAPTEDLEAIRKATGEMRGALARGASKMGPAILKVARQAKVTLALLAAKRFASKPRADEAPPRRMTAPPPAGALHSDGRRVVRQPSAADAREVVPMKGPGRRMALGAGVASIAVLSLVLFHRSAPSAAPAEPAPPAAAAPAPEPLPPMPASPAPLVVAPSMPGAPPLASPPAANVEASEDSTEPSHRRVHVAPFGSGAVAHGNLLRLKMDGVIEKIEGATTPTGFTVRVPSRRSLEAAAPLAARDGRIGAIHVTNDADGAELAVTFKDGVPNYQVRARGDSLEIVLGQAAQAGKLDADTEDSRTAREGSTAAAPKKHHVKHLERR